MAETPVAAPEEEEEEDDEDADDVEATLDEILKERLVVADEEEEDEEEVPDTDDKVERRNQGPAQAARRVRLPVVLPGEAPEPAGRRQAQAVPGLRVTSYRMP